MFLILVLRFRHFWHLGQEASFKAPLPDISNGMLAPMAYPALTVIAATANINMYSLGPKEDFLTVFLAGAFFLVTFLVVFVSSAIQNPPLKWFHRTRKQQYKNEENCKENEKSHILPPRLMDD
jgi:hypothetical protein